MTLQQAEALVRLTEDQREALPFYLENGWEVVVNGPDGSVDLLNRAAEEYGYLRSDGAFRVG